MKYIFTLTLAILLPLFLSAQTSGEIKFTQTSKVVIPDRVPKEFRDRFPKERKVNKVLTFNKATSTFKNGENLRQGEGGAEGEGRRFRFRGGGNANGITYKNLETKQLIDNRDIVGKMFIIEGEMESLTWKVTGQKKTILDYMALEATAMMNDTVSVVAFFTPQIPVSNGPATFQGLPGMILEVNVDNGRQVTVATEVTLKEIAAADLERPSSGKKVTQEEFEKIRTEKMKEMREQRGGQGRGGRGRFGG